MKKISGLLILMGMGIFIWATLAQNSHSQVREHSQSLAQSSLLEEVNALIQKRYPTPVDARELSAGAVDGMLKSLDSFSEHLSQREYLEIQNEVRGQYGGVGIIVALRGDYPKVIKVLPHSPAQAAGVQEGDEIVKIDGESSFRKTVFNVIEALRGPLGTEVSIDLKKRGTNKPSNVKLRRAKIIVESVREAKVIAPDVGYIRLMEFVENTREDFDQALKQLKEAGVKYLILDLRNNMGGTLDSAIQVSQVFLPDGKMIVKTDGRLSEDRISYFAREKNPELSLQLFVLVNRMSASASEIVASALKDNGRARIVGEKTFGKGSVQTVFPLSDGSAIRLTTAHYVTPKGNVIDQKGVEPDIELAFPDEFEQMKEIEEHRDSVLDKTLEIIHGTKTQS